MSDASPKKFNPAGIAIFLLITTILAAIVWQFALTRSPERGPVPFDRATASELEIKGDPPDGASSWSAIEVPKSPPATPELIARGRELFAKACLGCHGTQGKGDGPVTTRYELNSRPANLATPLQSIKLHTTFDEAGGGIPTDSDFFRTLTRGLPGTPMFSYRALPESERWALVHFVKTLAPDYANPSEVQAIPAKPADSADALKFGTELYRSICFNCHGDKGMGGTVLLQDPSGRVYPGLQFARDGGANMLGGSSDMDIARTLITGLNSLSPMRSLKTTLYPRENMTPEQRREGDRKLWGTVLYVRGLIEAAKPPRP